MNRQNTGLGFCTIAAFLFAFRSVTAPIMDSGLNAWSDRSFAAMLSHMGQHLTILSG